MIAIFVGVAAVFGALASGCKDRAKPEQAQPEARAGGKGQRDGGHGPEPVSLSVADALTQKGPATLIVGTAGDDRSDRSVAAQAALFRSMALTDATIVNDSSIDVAAGPSAWPDNPVVYGGVHINALISGLAPTLPIEVNESRLVIGGETLSGDEYAVIAAVPARPPDDKGPGYPEFVLYAGTGTPGIGEINAASRGLEQVLVVDRFGPLRVGSWSTTGALQVLKASRFPMWKTEAHTLRGHKMAGTAEIRFHLPSSTPLPSDRATALAMSGLRRAVKRLRVAEPAGMDVYLYASSYDKERVTTRGGDGHAVVYADTLHLVAGSNDGFESLAAHEGTHLMLYRAWGQPGSALLAEGVAVWAAGSYGGTPLSELSKRAPAEHPPVTELLGRGFRRMPEADAYAMAATLVDVLIEAVGIEAFAEHLWSVGPESWSAALAAAGTSAEAIEQTLAERLAAN